MWISDAGNKLFMTLFGSKDELKMIVPFMRGGSSEVDQMVDRLENVNAFNMATLGWDFSGEVGEQLEGCCGAKRGLGSIFGTPNGLIRRGVSAPCRGVV